MSMHHNMDSSSSSSMDMDMPGGHDHSGMGGNSCKMSMLLTWEYEDYCILTKNWHMKNKQDLILSMLFTIVLAIAYEAYKKYSSTYITKLKPRSSSSVVPSVGNGSGGGSHRKNRNINAIVSLIYGSQVFFSFLLMLIFMSFNYWIMISLCIGAAIGHYIFTTADNMNGLGIENSLACH